MQGGDAMPAEQARIHSLDQLRGYTVLGMFFVNFAGHFQVIPEIFKHPNTYCTYHDTIMPHFFFAVGFAYRLTLLKRLKQEGAATAYARVIRRNLGLILLGMVIYHLDGKFDAWNKLQALGLLGFLKNAFQREVFQTLVHIGVTALWILPVIAARPAIRVAFAGLSALLHIGLSHWFYYGWVMERPGIDGGPLGFLTWTLPMLAGSLAYDLVMQQESRRAIAKLLGWGFLAMLAGYAIACLSAAGGFEASRRWQSLLVAPPFVPPRHAADMWTMSQRAGSVSYLMFGSGFSLAVYALFVLVCDVGKIEWGVFRTLGTNALAAYIIHDFVAEAIKPLAPSDAPVWFVLTVTAIFLIICYVFLRHLEKNKLFLRL
jgi:predicted acyltransferase